MVSGWWEVGEIFSQVLTHQGLIFVLVYLFGLEGKVFANGPGDRGSIPGRAIPKTLKMVLDTSLLNTQQYTYQG